MIVEAATAASGIWSLRRLVDRIVPHGLRAWVTLGVQAIRASQRIRRLNCASLGPAADNCSAGWCRPLRQRNGPHPPFSQCMAGEATQP